ncbi:MAG: pirin family protein [Sediminibacterium sp.]|nr:pirin family protein [Sediminibacterium sp.]
MKKHVIFKISGHPSNVGEITVSRVLPNPFTHHIGHFVFLDYIAPFARKHKMVVNKNMAHPHRGIATLTYILNGEAEHFDSRGNHATIYSGGVQWMKSGNGIIHNEIVNADSKTDGLLNHGFQFWVNLPAKHKKENPDYMAVQANELPLLALDNNAGFLKVILGEFSGHTSQIPTYARQYLYHIRINEGKTFTLPAEDGLEYAVFLPQHDTTINDSVYFSGQLIGFDDKKGEIEITNHLATEADILLFGGEKYTEPFVAQGPFVMNTQDEIYQAHADYRSGKYGEIIYR